MRPRCVAGMAQLLLEIFPWPQAMVGPTEGAKSTPWTACFGDPSIRTPNNALCLVMSLSGWPTFLGPTRIIYGRSLYFVAPSSTSHKPQRYRTNSHGHNSTCNAIYSLIQATGCQGKQFQGREKEDKVIVE